METVNILTIITIAFLGSFGHCIGMCGGIVLAYSTIKIKENLFLMVFSVHLKGQNDEAQKKVAEIITDIIKEHKNK